MDDKRQKIADAAIRLVSRYGLRKTTMRDLAEAAGMSRQTLYNAYASKEDVIRATISYMTERGIADLEAAWAKDTSLADKLESYFTIGPISWFDLIQSSPDAADLLDDLNSAGAEELADGTKRWTETLAHLFDSHDATLARAGLSAHDLADFVYTSSSAAKYNAKSRDQLIVRLGALKAALLALLQ